MQLSPRRFFSSSSFFFSNHCNIFIANLIISTASCCCCCSLSCYCYGTLLLCLLVVGISHLLVGSNVKMIAQTAMTSTIIMKKEVGMSRSSRKEKTMTMTMRKRKKMILVTLSVLHPWFLAWLVILALVIIATRKMSGKKHASSKHTSLAVVIVNIA